METRVLFDDVRLESKENGITEEFKQHGRFRRIQKFSKIFKVSVAGLLVLVFTATVLFSTRVDAVLKSSIAGGFVIRTTHLLNHHVVFLIGNAIIFLLFAIFRRGEAVDGDFYDEYARHAPTANRAPVVSVGGEEEQIPTPSTCDDVAEAVEKAERLIRRFQSMESEKLKREIENRRNSECSDAAAAEIERLSSEEFRRRVDAFIDEHWCRKSEVYRVRSELSVS